MRGRRLSGAARSRTRPILVAAALILAVSVSVSAQDRQPLAEVNGEAIMADELDRMVAPQLAKLQAQIDSLKRQGLEALIRQKLLQQEAARRGTTVSELLDAEVTSKAAAVSEEQVERIYQANKSRLPSDEAAARQQVRSQLQSSRLGMARETFIRSLRGKGTVVVHLAPLPVARVQVATEGAPAKGPSGAPVSIVEFSDFHCPFCKQANSTLDQLIARYGTRVRLVFRDFPIDQLHPGARRAHEAARCAHEQGKFWPYHDVLFERAPQASADDLKAYANQVGLDLGAFDACLASLRHEATVRAEIEEGTRLGVTGTPAFFINGRLISGAQPLEAFTQLIDDELRRSAARP